MPATLESLRMRIARCKNLVAECPHPIDATVEIKELLEKAPALIRQAETDLADLTPTDIAALDTILEQTEAALTWAAGSARGEATVRAIKEGRATDPDLPVDQRLLNRLLMFTVTVIDRSGYLQLVRDFCGDRAVDGDRIYMEPTAETEAFSLWLLHDICLPGQPKRLIDVFAERHSAQLPEDEKALLKLRRADRPSIYKVVDLAGPSETPGIFLMQDVLSSGDSLRVWDVSASKTLQRGAIILARAVPYDERSDLFALLGSITELPPRLWDLVHPQVERWRAAFAEKHPGAAPDAFYRSHNARLNRRLLEIAESHEQAADIEAVKVGAGKKKLAADIHRFVMKARKKGRPVESLVGSPQIMAFIKKWKRLADTCSRAELDHLLARYEGFYDFSLLLENFAEAISSGVIKVP